MKRRTILSSILAIIACIAVISGSTFALFTSESSVNIAITSGKVSVVATLGAPSLYSADATLTEGTLVDKMNPLDKTGTILPTNSQGVFAGTYYYKNQTTEGHFLNGGTAAIEDGVLNIKKITPGDKVSTNVKITNESNVYIQYRVKINVLSGLKLYEGLVVKADGLSLQGIQKVGNWTYMAIPTTEEEKTIATIPVDIYLPLDAGNEYQDLSTSIQFTVEAVQGNAKTTNDILAQEVTATADVGTTNTVLSDNDGLVQATVPTAALADTSISSLTLKVKPQDTVSNITITSLQETLSYDVKVLETTTTNNTSAIKENNSAAITVRMFVGTGLTGVKLYHNTYEITNFTYDSTTGYIQFTTNSFSEYTVVYNKDIYVETVNENVSTITKYTAQEDAGLYQTEDGEFVVVDETTQEISDFGDNVARIGVTGYSTLQAAVDVANAATESLTITILKDFTQETAVGINKNVTIDLAGKTITNNVTGNRMIRLGDASLTILGNNGQVIIPESNIGSYGFVDMRNLSNVAYSTAVLTIKDTYFEGATSAGSFFKYRANGQTMIFENVKANSTYGNGEYYDGYYAGQNYSIVNGNGNQVTLTITGGVYTYDSRINDAGVFQVGNFDTDNIIEDSSDITFKNVKVVATCGPILEGHGSVSIDNCDFSISTSQTDFYSSAVSVALEGVATVVNGGNYSATFGAYVFSSGGEIDINGGSFKGTNSVLFAQTAYENRNALINVTDGTFDGKLSVSSVGSATAKIKISGGTFVNTSFEVTGNNASIEISGGTFDCNPTTYVETGCQVKDNGDGTYTVISKEDVIKQQLQTKADQLNLTLEGYYTEGQDWNSNSNYTSTHNTYDKYGKIMAKLVDEESGLTYALYEDLKLYLWSATNYTGDVLTLSNIDGIRGDAFKYNTTIKTLTINCNLEQAIKCMQNNTTIENVIFGSGVTFIPQRFTYRSQVKNVTLPNTVTTIERYAFGESYGLLTIDLPASVTVIDKEVLKSCPVLKTITINGNPSIDGYYMARDCAALEDVYFTGDPTFTDGKYQIFTNSQSGNTSNITVHFINATVRDKYLAHESGNGNRTEIPAVE